jgi:hypothetical protein
LVVLELLDEPDDELLQPAASARPVIAATATNNFLVGTCFPSARKPPGAAGHPVLLTRAS